MQVIKKILILSLAIFVSSCSHLHSDRYVANRDTAYLKAKNIQPLRIPPGLASDSISQEYPVSDRNYPDSAKQVSLIPPGL